MLLDSDNTWSLPSLETLTCLSLTNTPQLLQPSALTNCYLTFDYVLPTGNLAAFLSSCPSLQRLSLSLNSVRVEEDTPIETSLPALKYFTLISIDVRALAISRLFRSLMFPNAIYALAAFRAGIMFGDTAVNDCYCTLLRVMRSKFPVLKEAWLLVNSGGTDLPDMSIQFVLSHLPESLEDLNLTLRNIYLQGNSLFGDENAPFGGKLRSIAIINCDQLQSLFFEEMARMFEENGLGKVALVVEDCSDYDDVDYDDVDYDENGERVTVDPELLSFTGYIEAGQICVSD